MKIQIWLIFLHLLRICTVRHQYDVSSDPWSVMNALTLLCAPIKSSLLLREKLGGAHDALLKYQPSERVKSRFYSGGSKLSPQRVKARGDSESPQLFHYGPKSCHMMERIGYDFTKELGLNLGKGKCLYRKAKTLITTTRPEEGQLCNYTSLIRSRI